MDAAPDVAHVVSHGRAGRHTSPPSLFQRCKRASLPAYYAATLPLRRALVAWLAARGRAPINVVAYHRIADKQVTPWTTTNDVFRRQVAWLKRHFDLVSLAEAQRRVASRANKTPTVSITFDDGYADNCDQALPLLLDQKIPFTYFVTSRAALNGEPFEHDLKLGLRLAPNTPQQLRDLAAAGVEIGAHTQTHANLAGVHNRQQLYNEVIGAREDLQAALGCPVRYFAFPFGQHANLSREAFALAAAAGYKGVVSAYGGYNFPGGDAFHLQRPCVDGPELRLKNWVTLDPWRLWTIHRYHYRDRQ
jgi:peptidoglycan/xylan/chitin deacetylase (PgdA/CDA1 family)